MREMRESLTCCLLFFYVRVRAHNFFVLIEKKFLRTTGNSRNSRNSLIPAETRQIGGNLGIFRNWPQFPRRGTKIPAPSPHPRLSPYVGPGVGARGEMKGQILTHIRPRPRVSRAKSLQHDCDMNININRYQSL